VDSIKPQN